MSEPSHTFSVTSGFGYVCRYIICDSSLTLAALLDILALDVMVSEQIVSLAIP